MIDPQTGASGKTVGAVERAFSIVDALREAGGMTVSEVAESFDMPSSTAHVYLKTLRSVGYVIKDDGEYRLGLRFFRDGIAVRRENGAYISCESEIDELAAETGEVANLGVEENGQRVLLYQAEGSDAVYDNAPPGEYTNMHWTALGKALLAHRPESYIDDVIDVYGLPAQTDRTITDRDSLAAELERIRDQGYALEDEERRAGIRSVAVPIIVDAGVIGAISLSGPKSRLSDDRIGELLDSLRNTANVVELKYTYT
ncbi:IclR family transcriptional regulator [Natrinema salifodinae]|uniref:Transcriptional regulator, IclR family n=1 Tax=Natrinema salifodinae TaxID=1202768 RepID=A0A1I0MC34_9EURY|nr:IclR family transcriptional regulator [Natrinema salifodinae]SEV85276.1 transcriptional regulator, IclR family [Natrinema salifodinae]